MFSGDIRILIYLSKRKRNLKTLYKILEFAAKMVEWNLGENVYHEKKK